MGRGTRATFFVVFAITGFSALTLQVVWQRVMSLHAGVDLVSFTTVVAAFLGGLGIGNLLGGQLADRLGPRRSIAGGALANVGIAAFASISLFLLYDVYEGQAEHLASVPAKFGFNFVLLLVPTVLMGLSTPLAARAVVSRIDEAGSLVGRLYAVNTLGAAAGAAVTGWLLMGSLGFARTAHVAAALNLVAAALLVVTFRRTATDPTPERPRGTATDPTAADPTASPDPTPDPTPAAVPARVFGDRTAPWYLIYGLTGAVALGFEVVFFRLVDTALRSNSYSFAHVLSLYLLLFGSGTTIATRFVRRTRRPDLWFLWVQFGIGITAVGGLITLIRLIPRTPLADTFRSQFSAEGLAVGFTAVDGTPHANLPVILVVLPLIVMGLPVLAMGMAFPFAEALVSERVERLGRHTGRLLFANIVGNVTGTLVVGFWMLDRMGTSRTMRFLALALLVPGIVAAMSAGPRLRRAGTAAVAALAMLGAVALVPSNQRIYAELHAVPTDQLTLVEDRTCAAALRQRGEQWELTVNGSPQNDYPFDDFHVLVGATPAMLHPDPQSTMALGLGIGGTPYGLSMDPRVDHVSTVEICGGEIPLLHSLRDAATPEQPRDDLRELFADPRQDFVVGDGRDFLLRAPHDDFDVVVVDTLRSQSAFSGSLYSVEFYELVRDRLSSDGMLAQWEASPRVMNTITEVFPYVVQFRVWSYYGSIFLVASESPITVDHEQLVQRALATEADGKPAPITDLERRARVADFFRTAEVTCIADGVARPLDDPAAINRDLRPLDEYFLNNPEQATRRATCG